MPQGVGDIFRLLDQVQIHSANGTILREKNRHGSL
jgi:hypothetical protein